MPTVTVVTEGWTFDPQVIGVLQLTNLDPADGDANLAPGAPITFDLLNSGHSRIFNFEDQSDALWTRCTYADGWTQALWNTGGADEWDIYDDDGNDVYRAQGQATSVLMDGSLYAASMGAPNSQDIVFRVKWFTGATAGMMTDTRTSPYDRTTGGIYGVGVEIDSGGLRLVYYTSATRYVDATAAFTPVNGTWYWVRVQAYSWGARYWRAKVWTGGRFDEDATWDITWNNAGVYLGQGSDEGVAVRCHAGTAYFDNVEVRRFLDPGALAKLEVIVNGGSCTVANGRIRVSPATVSETWNGVAFLYPQVNRWLVEVDPDGLMQGLVGTATVVVEFDGQMLSSTNYDVTRIGGAWPTYDPATEAVSGDPDRMSWRDLSSPTTTMPEGVFAFFRTIFPLSWGTQDAGYTVSPLAWPTSCYEDFIWLLYTPYYTPVDGSYLIGHPVYLDVPASLVVAIPAVGDFPSDVVVRGSLDALFPANIVPQGYRRTDIPALVIPSYQLWWEGTSSAVVGQEQIAEFDGSTLMLARRAGTVVHLRVLTPATYEKAKELGITFWPSHRSHRIEVVTDTWVYDEQPIGVNPP